MLATTQVGEVLMLDTATTVHLLCGTRLTNCTNCAARVNPITGKPSPVTPTARLVIKTRIRAGALESDKQFANPGSAVALV